MIQHTFLATQSGGGIRRAVPNGKGGWPVELVLPEADVRALAADPLNKNTVYAGTQGAGVFRSDDAGGTWKPAGLPGRIVKSLTVSPLEAGVVYAGTKDPLQIFVSRDRGANWSALGAIPSRWYFWSPAEWPFKAYVQAIVLSPVNPKVILAGIEYGAVLRSDDGGLTWSSHCPGALRDCHSLFYHSRDENFVYEAGAGGGSVSRDGGRTWQRPKNGLDRRYGWASAADPGAPDIWYISASPHITWSMPGPPAAHVDGHANAAIFRKKGEALWEKLSGGLPQPLNFMAYALLIDPANPGHLYAGLSNGAVWHSTNFGDQWTPLPFDLKGIQRCLIML